MISKAKYIGIGTAITTVSALIVWMLASPDFVVTTSPDIFCSGTVENPCISYINVTFKPQNPLVGSFYIYNKEKVKLDFSPEIRKYALCKKDARYKKERSEDNLCGAGYREILISPYSAGATYFYKFYKGVKEEWMLVGLKKNPYDKIKWSLTAMDRYVDPIWFASAKEICKNAVVKPERTYYEMRPDQVLVEAKCIDKQCINGSFIKSEKNDTYYIYQTVYVYNKTVIEPAVIECLPTGVVVYQEKQFGFDDYFCKLNKDMIYCYSCMDGRCQYGDGPCKDGESCIEYNLLDDKTKISNSIGKPIFSKPVLIQEEIL